MDGASFDAKKNLKPRIFEITSKDLNYLIQELIELF